MLRTALTTIHRDPRWWQTVLLGGALMTTLLGYPLAAGLVIESLDNSRKGYPTPLPPWHDWSTRYLLGTFALLIDFFYIGFPLLVGALVSLCLGMAAFAASSANNSLPLLAAAPGVLALLLVVALFLCSVSPVARLVYAQQGTLDAALGSKPLRLALRSPLRRAFWRARLASLPAYLPVLALVLLWLLLARQPVTSLAGIAGLLLLAWLTCSALLYAHLVVVQLYVAAERQGSQPGTNRSAAR